MNQTELKTQLAEASKNRARLVEVKERASREWRNAEAEVTRARQELAADEEAALLEDRPIKAKLQRTVETAVAALATAERQADIAVRATAKAEERVRELEVAIHSRRHEEFERAAVQPRARFENAVAELLDSAAGLYELLQQFGDLWPYSSPEHAALQRLWPQHVNDWLARNSSAELVSLLALARKRRTRLASVEAALRADSLRGTSVEVVN